MNADTVSNWSKYARLTSVVVIAVGVPLLFIPWNDTYEPRSLKEAWNFGHVILFASATLLLSVWWPWFRERAFEIQIAVLVVLALALGITIEFIQLHTGGDFSYHDVYLDVTGACLIPALKPQCRGWLSKSSLWILRLLVVSYLLVRMYPLGVALVDEYQAHRQFPVLADFSSSLEHDRFGGGRKLSFRKGGMMVTFGTEKYSGFSLDYFPRDWKGYAHVIIELVNPGNAAVQLTCRIHDELHDQSYHDRYNRSFTVRPGSQAIKISLAEVKAAPRTRSMDMGRIGALGCFTISLKSPVRLFIKKIALTRP